MSSRFERFTHGRIIRHIVLVFVLIVIMFIAIWTWAFIESRNDFNQGKYFFHKEEYIKAITFFDRSMHWYAPFNPYVEKSAKSLWRIAELSENGDDEKISIIALECIKNSFYSARSFYSPGRHWVERCEKKLKNIIKEQGKESTGINNAGSSKNLIDTGFKYNDPALVWTIILELGLFSWIGTVIAFIFIYLGPNKHKFRYVNKLWFWVPLFVFCYSLWIAGMLKA